MLRKGIFGALLAALLLTGCSMQTVDKMYCLPKRSEEYNNLQSVIDKAMIGLSYCAPLTGENQQTVQMADLDGDGVMEYLLFAKGSAEKPLQILIFQRTEEQYTLAWSIESYGAAFDQVEYVQMDGQPGVELVVGRQLSDQILRAVSVYTFSSGQAEELVTANYTKYLCCDLDLDTVSELFVLCPGQTDMDNGVAEIYRMADGVMVRSPEVNMSEPVDKLKRIITGALYGGQPAIYVASAVEENAIITDVYACVDGVFTNVSLSNESGTSVQTLRNYYVYADDIDDDGAVELPDLITMPPVDGAETAQEQYLIRWYALYPNGEEIDKMYTYHNFTGGWYLELDKNWTGGITVVQQENAYAFYLWDASDNQPEKVFTVFVFSGQDREEQAVAEDRFVLYKADTAAYAARLEPASGNIGVTQQMLIDSFHLIRQDWKTGET